MLIYVKGDRWTQVGVEKIVELTPQLTLREDCVVVWDSERQLVGVIGLDGDSRHAAVLIERRLRTEGTIDQETKVLVHHIERVGTTYQALYSGVAMREWQQLHKWSSSQSTHCAWVPLMRLALNRVKADRGVVVHTSDALYFIARSGMSMVFCSVVVMDRAHESLVYNASALSERASEELARERGTAAHEPLRVTWLTSLVSIEFDEARQLHEAFCSSRAFEVEAESADIATPAETVRSSEVVATAIRANEDTSQYVEPVSSFELQFDDASEAARVRHRPSQINVRTSLLTLGQAPPIKLLLNTPREKLLLSADRCFAAIVLCTAIFALGGLYLAFDAWRQAARLDEQAQAVRAETASAESELSTLITSEPKDAQAELAFLQTLHKVQADLDVEDIMSALREAAGADLRILSVRSEEAMTKDSSVQQAVLVEGLLLPNSTVPDSIALSQFVRALARSGYVAQPAESRSSGATAADVSSRLFSYRITHDDGTTSKGTS